MPGESSHIMWWGRKTIIGHARPPVRLAFHLCLANYAEVVVVTIANGIAAMAFSVRL